MTKNNNNRIFISYSHRGNGLEWKERFLTQLAVFEKHHVIDPWHDDETKLGDDWHSRINLAMTNARLAVLLLTDEFLKSPFVLQHELPELQRRQKEGELIVAPILCEKCDWEANPWLASLQIKPREQATPVPLASLSQTNRDHTLRQLATEIAVEIGGSALADYSALRTANTEFKTYLDKFPLTKSGGKPEKLIGREQELALLDLAFAQPHTAIVSLVAWGGVGKTMLVQHWLQRLQREDWFGVRRVYAWSFYSQGTKEDRQASEDSFLAHALEWFGVQCEPTLSPWDKGRLLAEAVASERTLLILDGIEPLQYPPGPMGGQLRAPGVQSLLKQLARKANNTGLQSLCLVTTRELLTDLTDFERRPDAAWGSMLRVDLGNLTEEAGAALLHHAGAICAGAAEIKNNDKELVAASREVDGHALTLNLLGRFLARTRNGDIRQRDLVKFEEADRYVQGGTTFKMLAAFENWFAKSGEFGARQLAVLRIIGLFDRPADAGCISALRNPPIIVGLTDPLFTTRLDANSGQLTAQPFIEEDWNTATSFLADFSLISILKDDINEPSTSNPQPSLDCHPLIREHFSRALLGNSHVAWCSAHHRLYEHLFRQAKDKPDPSLEDLQPLYNAVMHGCRAGLRQEVFEKVYLRRIERGGEHYSTWKLGTVASNLGMIECFFETPWKALGRGLSEDAKSYIMSDAGTLLMALGRMEEALNLMMRSFVIYYGELHLTQAASVAINISCLYRTLGFIQKAISMASLAVEIAQDAQDILKVVIARTCLAASLHHAGDLKKAIMAFEDSMIMFSTHFPGTLGPIPKLLYEQYCAELALAERLSWKLTLSPVADIPPAAWASLKEHFEDLDSMRESMEHHGLFRLKMERRIVDIAYERLTFAFSALNHEILQNSRRLFDQVHFDVDEAINYFHHATSADQLPQAFLVRAWLRFLESDTNGAQSDLDEAWDIAERGPMRLHMADIHLYRSRLFFREKHYPWKSPLDDLAAAEKLINECGYHRRDEELADAKRIILNGKQ